jgi:transcriptional regulator with XRE-family HTH domain
LALPVVKRSYCLCDDKMPKSLFGREYRKFCALLFAERKAADLTQAEVAIKLRKPQSFVSKYEQGERRLDVVEFLHIARVIGFDPYALLKRIR